MMLLKTELYRKCEAYADSLSVLLTRNPLRHAANHTCSFLVE